MYRIGLAMCGVLWLSGCVISSDDGGAVATTGTLIVEWTIDDATNPAECRQSSVASVDIAVDTARGHAVGDFEEDCEAFTTSIELDPGSYSAEAVLVDPRGEDRTTPIQIPTFTIVGNDELHIPVDFPSDSFF